MTYILGVGYDFGRSSTKITLSIRDGDKEVVDPVIDSLCERIPSIGFYDYVENEWFFGEDAINSSNITKKPIINIRDLFENCLERKNFDDNVFDNRDIAGYSFRTTGDLRKGTKALSRGEVVSLFFNKTLSDFKRKIYDALSVDSRHSVNMPSFTNKLNLGVTCPSYYKSIKKTILKNFFEATGNHVVRMTSSAIAAGINVAECDTKKVKEETLIIDIGEYKTELSTVSVSNYKGRKVIQPKQSDESFPIGGIDFDPYN